MKVQPFSCVEGHLPRFELCMPDEHPGIRGLSEFVVFLCNRTCSDLFCRIVAGTF